MSNELMLALAVSLYWLLLPWILPRRKVSKFDYIIELPWFLIFLVYVLVSSLLRSISNFADGLQGFLYRRFRLVHLALDKRHRDETDYS